METPKTIYRTTRDNADYYKLHAKRWYGSDEAFNLKKKGNRIWYENEYGEKLLGREATKERTKQDILEWYAYLFENDNSFRED
jgi:hypothetical protein